MKVNQTDLHKSDRHNQIIQIYLNWNRLKQYYNKKRTKHLAFNNAKGLETSQ